MRTKEHGCKNSRQCFEKIAKSTIDKFKELEIGTTVTVLVHVLYRTRDTPRNILAAVLVVHK